MATNSTTTKHESNDQYVNLQAPPPTPSNHHDHHDSFSTSQLSFILNQILIPPLKPILSSPSPTISFLLPNHKTKLSLLSTVTRHPFFHLKDLHIHIPSHLPPSSLLESKSLLPSKNFSSLCFNKDEDDDDEDDDEAKTLQVLEPTSIDPNTLPSLHEFTQCLQKVAMEVLEMLFDGTLDHEGAPTPRFLIWISKSKEKKDELEMEMEMERRRNSKCYPYVMCMQYEMRGRGRTSWVVGDSGELVSIPFRADSLLVTLGDIAQVWSNGRFKKARGVPFQSSSSNHDYNGNQSFISLTFMVTLPLESTISPLLPLKIKDDNNNGGEEEDADDDGWERFTPFLMVDYAWKVYHERFTEKDPLIQYRIPEV